MSTVLALVLYVLAAACFLMCAFAERRGLPRGLRWADVPTLLGLGLFFWLLVPIGRVLGII